MDKQTFLDALEEVENEMAFEVENHGSPCATCGSVFCNNCPYV